MRHVFKVYKLLTTLFFALIILGLIFPTNIQDNALIVFKTLNSEGVVGVITGILLGFLLMTADHGKKLLHTKLLNHSGIDLKSLKGKLREFWNEI